MSATDEFRALLDERGIEWWGDAFFSEHRTVFDGEYGVRYCIYEFGDLLFISSILPVTPDQAVEATLGAKMNPREDPVIKMAISARKNHWQCYGKNGFTWLAGENCPDYGSSDCPMTMDEDRPCKMTDERESQLISQRWKVKQ